MSNLGKKLMEQMGYVQGKGIGKNLQGRSDPIVAKPRQGKGALGLYGDERDKVNKRNDDRSEKEVSDEENKKQIRREKRQKIRTVNELINFNNVVEFDDSEEIQFKRKRLRKKENRLKMIIDDEMGEEDEIERNLLMNLSNGSRKKNEKIIDMRGKESFELFDLKNEMTKSEDDEEKYHHFDVKELRINLNKSIKELEKEILDINRNKQIDEQNRENIRHQLNNLNDEQLSLDKQLENVNNFFDLIDKIYKEKNFDKKLEEIGILLEIFETELSVYDLNHLPLSLMIEMMNENEEMINWNILKYPENNIDRFLDCERILGPSVHSMNGITNYIQFIWETWLPHVRKGIATDWNGKSKDLHKFFTLWKMIIPEIIYDYCLDSLIIPKINYLLENDWNPSNDSLPVHQWTLNWKKFLRNDNDNKLEETYSVIQRKFSNIFIDSDWDCQPSTNHQIIEMLLPWKEEWKSSDWETFILRNIIPKLSINLKEIDLSKNHQELQKWNILMEWSNLIPSNFLAQMFNENFFPKWLHFLYEWLSNENCSNYLVGKWYKEWKNGIPSSILNEVDIQHNFNLALQMMKEKMTKNQITCYSNKKRMKSSKLNIDLIQTKMVNFHSNSSMDIKDVLQAKATEHNILLLSSNKLIENKSVYVLGDIFIRFERGNIITYRDSIWQPLSIMEAIELGKGTNN
ncbi:hypothetical protein SNEBB_001645 [Seison nebaliae]|nr:hypothetical protein SNEBB_001645 [Seison nebaliae]